MAYAGQLEGNMDKDDTTTLRQELRELIQRTKASSPGPATRLKPARKHC